MTFRQEYGNIHEFEKQLTICKQLSLPTPFPVYKAWKPKSNQLVLTIRTFAKENYPVTVRQIFYNLVSRQIVESSIQTYHEIVRIVKNMRLAGIIPFKWVVDDTRRPEKTPTWNSVSDILHAAIEQFRSDWQQDQRYYVEVWLEKRSLRRFFYPITNNYDIFLCVGGGYQSYDMIEDASVRFKERAEKGQYPVILYFGDLNPSGKDMPRDIKRRLAILGANVDIIEVALTTQDILDFQLPQNPFKNKDTRAKWYLQKYGVTYSVELDALPPNILRDRIKKALELYLDIPRLFDHRKADKIIKDQVRQLLQEHDFLGDSI